MGGRGTQFRLTKTVSAVVEQRTAGGGGGEAPPANTQTTAGGGGGEESASGRVRPAQLDWKSGGGTVYVSDDARRELATSLGRNTPLTDKDVLKLFGVPANGTVSIRSDGPMGRGPWGVTVSVPGVTSGAISYEVFRTARGQVRIDGMLAIRDSSSTAQRAGVELVRQLVAGAKEYGVSKIEISGAAGRGRAIDGSGRVRRDFNGNIVRENDPRWTGFKSWIKYGWDRALTRTEKQDASRNGINMKGIRTVGQLMATKAGENYWRDFARPGNAYSFNLRSGSRSLKTLNDRLKRLNISGMGPII